MGTRELVTAALLAVLGAGCGEEVGTGGQRLPSVIVQSVDFGAVVEQTTKTVEVELANPLPEPLEVRPVRGSPPFGTLLFEPVTVAAGGSVALPLVFTPDLPGPATGRLEVRSSHGVLARFDVAGRGVDDEGLRCDARLDFGPQPREGPPAVRTFRCENASAGETRLYVGAIAGEDPAAFGVELEAAGVPRALGAGEVLEVPVSFQPRSYGGLSFAWVEVYRQDDVPRGRVLLAGTTAESCFFAVVPPEGLAFDCLAPGEAETRRITVRNGCAEDVEVVSVLLEGAGAASFSVAPDHVPLRVAAAVDGTPGEAEFEVTFAPRATNGPAVTARLVLSVLAGAGYRLEVPLSGCLR